jgi:hypothetical protein
MSETHRRRGTLVPGTRVWTPEENELLKTLPEEDGADPEAIHTRRQRSGMPDGSRQDCVGGCGEAP